MHNTCLRLDYCLHGLANRTIPYDDITPHDLHVVLASRPGGFEVWSLGGQHVGPEAPPPPSAQLRHGSTPAAYANGYGVDLVSCIHMAVRLRAESGVRKGAA